MKKKCDKKNTPEIIKKNFPIGSATCSMCIKRLRTKDKT